MAAITFINQVPSSNVPSAEFRLSQGFDQLARIGVHSGGQVSIPSGPFTYSVQAVTQMGDFKLTSNTLTFTGTFATVLAQVLNEDGYFDFQVVQLPGTRPQTLVCENTWREPVQFNIQVPGTPVQIVKVVDEGNTGEVTTVQQWSAYAIVNGITTGTVSFTDPNAVITLVANNDSDSYTLVLTGSAPAEATAPKAATPQEASASATQQEASTGATVIPVTSAA